MSIQTILISILNWNTADATLACVQSVLDLAIPPGVTLSLIVIDNGSERDDFQRLRQGLLQHARADVVLHREERNHGFAGGHNIAIRQAIDCRHDYIWLVNSDALIEERQTLATLTAAMQADPRCGAASPVIVTLEDARKVQFAGAMHDWSHRQSPRFDVEESKKLHEKSAEHLWVLGTAILFRVAALREVGLLDERLFAYFEDDDIAARLSRAGWHSRVVFDAVVRHPQFRTETDRPAYYFYLMKRNYLIFWYQHTPAPFRKMLLLKLLDQSLFEANKLYRKGFMRQGDASLLGIHDFLMRRYGPPDLSRRVPLFMRLLCRLFRVQQAQALANVK